MAERSPNFPSLSLGDAVEAIKKVFQAEGRSKMPRLSVVTPLGYTSINGRSLSILGALKAYGLVEGRADELRVTDDGFTLANAPDDSPEYRDALVTCFKAPPAFQRFLPADDDASADTLKWKLQKAGFQGDSAERLVRVYRDSQELVNASGGEYQAEVIEVAGEASEGRSAHSVFDDMKQMAFGPKPLEAAKRFVQHHEGASPQDEQSGLAMGIHERVLQSGMLSKAASYRVVVSGPVGVAEIDRLLKKLEMDKEILADVPEVPAMPASGGFDPEGEAAYENWKSDPNAR